MRRACLLIAVLAGALMPAIGHTDEVRVDVAINNEFGRLVFAWPFPVSYQLQVDNRELVLRFGRPIKASYKGVRKILGKYISSVENLPDGRSVRVRLTDTFDAYSYDSGSTVVLEIAKLGVGKSSLSQKNIQVRTGEHGAYTRVVFDWRSKVDYTFEQSEGIVTLDFKRSAKLELAHVQKSPPRFVGQIKSVVTADGVRVAIAVSKTSSARHFLFGPKVVVDIAAPTGSEKIAALPKDLIKSAVLPKTNVKAPTAKKQPPLAASRPTSQDVPVVGQPTPVIAPGKPTALIANNRQPSRQASRNTSDETVTAKISGSSDAMGKGRTLTFDWDEPVAAAVFRRVGYLWVAFDKSATIDVDALKRAGGGMIDAIQQVPATSGTVLRMVTRKDVHPSLSRSGLSWVLNFKKQNFEAQSPIEIIAQPDSPVGSRIFIPVPEPGAPIGVTDPDVGDNFVIVPIIPLGHGVVISHTYPEARILQTIQGIAVVPMIDNLRVRPLRQGVELASSVPLNLSSVSDEVAAGAKLGSLSPITRLLDLEKWLLPDLKSFTKRKQELQGDITFAKGDQAKQEARYDMARFYFANTYAPEALGVLRSMSDANIDIEDEAEFRLLRGGANYLMYRFADAVEDLGHSSLDEADEGAFWRAAVIAKSGEVIAAAHELRRTAAITQRYPKELRIIMLTLVADAVVAVGDIQQGQQYIESLKLVNPNKKQLAEIDFIEGKLLEVGGDEEGAIMKWEEVLKLDNRPTRFKATMARMDMLMKMGRMEPEEAIEELETLRFVWRGDEDEFKLLRRLGDLYLSSGRYRNGLQALRQAATYYRDNEDVPQVTQQMSDTFNSLYLGGDADALAPVTAIALYEEFKELTPPGRKGDEMIRNLADRLVQVDLLDHAADLLQKQVQFRLKGDEKSEVGASLALVHALAQSHDKVLAVLDASEEPGIPEELVMRRRHLRAQALMSMKKHQDALALLKTDKSLDANLIRSELFWGQGDWKNAALSLRNVVRLSGIKPGQVLSEDQASKILNLATTYTLSGNERGVQQLRVDYMDAMEQTSLKEPFKLVAAPLSLGMIDPGSISERVKTVTNFRSYLDTYKERLKKERLSRLSGEKVSSKETVPAS